VPITSVFLFLFLLGAITHMYILQTNQRRSHKFLFSGALFGFCMARLVTCVMRIVWSQNPTNISVAIAANVFVNAGVIIIVIINLLFTQRIVRAQHPHLGWHRTTHWVFTAYLISIGLNLVMLIVSIVHSLYTLDPVARDRDNNVHLVGATYNAVAAFLPIPIIVLSILSPRSHPQGKTDKFGSGRFRSKVGIILFSTVLISLSASFRCAVAFLPRPASDPAWFDSRAAFYCLIFVLEVIVIFLYAAVRVDRRFHVPNGARGGYSASSQGKGEGTRFETEEEFMDDLVGESAGEVECGDRAAEKELKMGINESPASRPA
jgi:hypothetical protein